MILPKEVRDLLEDVVSLERSEEMLNADLEGVDSYTIVTVAGQQLALWDGAP